MVPPLTNKGELSMSRIRVVFESEMKCSEKDIAKLKSSPKARDEYLTVVAEDVSFDNFVLEIDGKLYND